MRYTLTFAALCGSIIADCSAVRYKRTGMLERKVHMLMLDQMERVVNEALHGQFCAESDLRVWLC